MREIREELHGLCDGVVEDLNSTTGPAHGCVQHIGYIFTVSKDGAEPTMAPTHSRESSVGKTDNDDGGGKTPASPSVWNTIKVMKLIPQAVGNVCSLAHELEYYDNLYSGRLISDL